MEESLVVQNSAGRCHTGNGHPAAALAVSALTLLLAEDEEVENLEDSSGVENKQHNEPRNRLERAGTIQGKALPDAAPQNE